MTNEKTINYLKCCVGDGSIGFVYQPIKTEVLENAIKALEKVEKYKWHDLTKNPDDLPCEDGTYRCVSKDDINNYFDCYYMKGIGFGENVFDAHNELTGSPIEYYFEGFDEDDEVIGWQEKDQFERS